MVEFFQKWRSILPVPDVYPVRIPVVRKFKHTQVTQFRSGLNNHGIPLHDGLMQGHVGVASNYNVNTRYLAGHFGILALAGMCDGNNHIHPFGLQFRYGQPGRFYGIFKDERIGECCYTDGIIPDKTEIANPQPVFEGFYVNFLQSRPARRMVSRDYGVRGQQGRMFVRPRISGRPEVACQHIGVVVVFVVANGYAVITHSLHQ